MLLAFFALLYALSSSLVAEAADKFVIKDSSGDKVLVINNFKTMDLKSGINNEKYILYSFIYV
jgi:hypothetical protein